MRRCDRGSRRLPACAEQVRQLSGQQIVDVVTSRGTSVRPVARRVRSNGD